MLRAERTVFVATDGLEACQTLNVVLRAMVADIA